MKTDKEIYTLFSSYTEILFQVAGITTNASYTFRSETFKQLEKRTDGFLYTPNRDEPLYIFECQGYEAKDIYFRVVMEMAFIGERYPTEK